MAYRKAGSVAKTLVHYLLCDRAIDFTSIDVISHSRECEIRTFRLDTIDDILFDFGSLISTVYSVPF